MHRDRAALIESAMGPEAGLVKPRFDRGCRCYAATVDGSIAGYGWLSTGPEWIGELQLEIAPGPGEGYVWNCVTVPEHRKKGVFRALLFGVSRAGHEEGLKRLWIGSVAIPAEKAVGPSGFRRALRFVTASAAGLHLLQVEPSDPILAGEGLTALNTSPGWHFRRSRIRRH